MSTAADDVRAQEIRQDIDTLAARLTESLRALLTPEWLQQTIAEALEKEKDTEGHYNAWAEGILRRRLEAVLSSRKSIYANYALACRSDQLLIRDDLWDIVDKRGYLRNWIEAGLWPYGTMTRSDILKDILKNTLVTDGKDRWTSGYCQCFSSYHHTNNSLSEMFKQYPSYIYPFIGTSDFEWNTDRGHGGDFVLAEREPAFLTFTEAADEGSCFSVDTTTLSYQLVFSSSNLVGFCSGHTSPSKPFLSYITYPEWFPKSLLERLIQCSSSTSLYPLQWDDACRRGYLRKYISAALHWKIASLADSSIKEFLSIDLLKSFQ